MIGRSYRRRWGQAVAAAMMVTGLGASVAQAGYDDFRIASFTTGTTTTVAGAHPDLSTKITFPSELDGAAKMPFDGNARDIQIALPPGVVGNPMATAQCEVPDLTAGTCPVNAQVGIATLILSTFGPEFFDNLPIFNMAPLNDDELARVAFFDPVFKIPVNIVASVRSGSDYGITTRVATASRDAPLVSAEVSIWGVPADASHDALRSSQCGGLFGCTLGTSSFAPLKPFLTNPTRCAGPVTTVATVDSYQRRGRYVTASSQNDPVTECDRLAFDPSIDVRPESTVADTPSGAVIDVFVPQNEAPYGRATAHLRNTVATLPEGMTISPSAAGGLAACSDEQLNVGSEGDASCPAASKIGTVTVDTPVLPDPLSGSVYVGSQLSDDPQSGEMFRIFLVVKGHGVVIKLRGQVKADRQTGRLQTTFLDNPQLPFSKLRLELKEGARAPLATPAACGSKTTVAHFDSWGGQSVDRHSSFAIGCPGVSGFAPGFAAGTTNPVAAAFSPFAVAIERPDGQQYLDGVKVELPAGVLARLKGVPLCPEAQAAAGSCPSTTRIGTAIVGSGPGAHPFSLPGTVSLTDGYGGAPYGLSVAVAAKAGPFDLGMVVVRQRIYIDPITAQVSVVSDPLPTIVKGVPVRLRTIDVTIDRPGFTLNPTSCAAKEVKGALHAVDATTKDVSVRFQAGDCAALDLQPKLDLALSGKGQTVDNKHPAVTAVLTQKPGQSNLKKVRVALPLSVALDPDNANGLCEFADGSKPVPTCPKSSIVGTATTTTPILDQPLSGPVYFVKNIRKDPKSGREIRTLPKLVIPLTGQNGLRLTLTGTSDVDHDQLVTTFDNIPDAPVSSFKMSIIGGKGGILVVSGTDICKSTQVADQQIDGQNNKNADADVYIQTPSCPLKVLSKKVGKTSVAVKIGGLGAGRITMTGKGIRKTTKTISKSTVATITAKRSKGKAGKVTVSFDPAGPAKARKITK